MNLFAMRNWAFWLVYLDQLWMDGLPIHEYCGTWKFKCLNSRLISPLEK